MKYEGKLRKRQSNLCERNKQTFEKFKFKMTLMHNWARVNNTFDRLVPKGVFGSWYSTDVFRDIPCILLVFTVKNPTDSEQEDKKTRQIQVALFWLDIWSPPPPHNAVVIWLNQCQPTLKYGACFKPRTFWIVLQKKSAPPPPLKCMLPLGLDPKERSSRAGA